MNSTYFHKEDIYDDEILPLVNKIKQICSRENMPMFITVCISNDDGSTQYKNEMISAATHEISLTDNRIPHFLNVTLGFETVLPNAIPEIDFD